MRRRRLALPAPRRSSCSPGGALPGSRVCCAHGRVRAHGRAWRSRERGRDGGRALTRSVSSPRPRTRVWLCRLARAHGGRRLAFPLSLSSVHSRCLPHRTAAARGCVPSFPSGCSVPFLGGGARPVPRRGKGSAPRRRPAAALSPWLPGARAGRSRRRARGRERARRRGGGPPSRVFHPRTLSGYLATAFRRVGLKTPGGVASPSPGSGGRRGPSGAVDVRRLPRTPVPHAVVGSGAPSWAPVGLASACPVRRCVVGRGPRVCRSRPAFLVSCLLSRWPARGEPLSAPPAASPGAAGGEGDCAAVSSHPKGKTLVRLLAVDHSARASMKNAASCEN